MNFIKLFRWIKGYVIVECSGDNTASFINFLFKRKISIWNITKSGKNTVFSMFLKDYLIINKLRRESKSSVILQHIGFFGLPRKFISIKKRPSVLVGLLCFSIILIFISSFIWNIEIVGNEKIAKEKIVEAYTELGVKVGMQKHKLDSYSLKEKLPLVIRDVSWCSFNLEGTLLTINITEIKETDKSNKNEYSNIVAKIDGIIKQIDIISGNKCVNVGDVVAKGELLISGAPELNLQNFTFSKGEIIAETNREFVIRIPKQNEYNLRTGKVIKRNIINLFGFNIPLYLDSVHFDYVTKSNIQQVKINNAALPIAFYSKTFYETIKVLEEISLDNALNEARANLISQIKNIDLRSIEINEIYSSENDEFYIFNLKCKCIENISEVTKINIS